MPRRCPAIAALLALLATADACSLFLYHCPGTGDSVVSGRSEDFIPQHSVGWRIDVTPPGHRHTGAPACPTAAACGPPATWSARHGFAGLTALNGSALMDAMNSEGLFAGYLWLDGAPFELEWSPDKPGMPLAWLDVIPYLLGNFATVKEAVHFLMSDKVQVTTSLPPMPYQQVLKALGFREFQIPLHLALMDASGDAAVIEYTAEGAKTYWDAMVVTNDPPYPQHQHWYKRWMAEVKRATAADKGMDMLPTPPPSYAKLPGSFESIARSVRLRMLVDAACKDGGPYQHAEWAPRPGGIAPNTAIAMSILRSAEVPWGATGQSIPGTFSAGDSLISLLHEHTTGRYLFRSPGNPRWQAVSLREADWAAFNGEVKAIELSTNHESWYGDVTPALRCKAGECLEKGAAAQA